MNFPSWVQQTKCTKQSHSILVPSPHGNVKMILTADLKMQTLYSIGKKKNG